jgi:competence protein ComEA
MNFPQKTTTILGLIIATFVFGAGVYYANSARPDDIILHNQSLLDEEKPNEDLATVVVDVAGQVANPGVFEFSEGKRVDDAVTKAVPLPDADLDAINLAAPLSDGQFIFVPSLLATSEDSIPPGSSIVNAPGTKRVNLNLASQNELQSLPGIGPTLAQRIIDYREANGSFQNPEDIKNVTGIGEKRYEDIKELISIH